MPSAIPIHLIEPDFDPLLEALLPEAEQQIREYGHFLFSIAYIGMYGQIYSAGMGHLPAEELLARLEARVRSGVARFAFRAAAIIYHEQYDSVRTGERTDAIVVHLENRLSHALHVIRPYAEKRTGEIYFGQIVANPADPGRLISDARDAT